MNHYCKVNFYYLLFFIASLVSIRGTSIPSSLEDLNQTLLMGTDATQLGVKLFRFYNKNNNTKVNKVDAKGLTTLNAILQNTSIKEYNKKLMLEGLNKQAKTNKEPINFNQKIQNKTLLEFILETDDPLPLLNTINTIHQEQKNTYDHYTYELVTTGNIIQLLSIICSHKSLRTSKQTKLMERIKAMNLSITINVSKKNEKGDTLLATVFSNSDLKLGDLAKLMKKVSEIATKKIIDPNEKDSGGQTVFARISGNSKLSHDDQALLIIAIYEHFEIKSTLSDDSTKKLIKGLLNSSQLDKSKRDELTKLTGLKPSLITRGLYYAQENTKTTIFTLLVILGTIIYSVWQYVKKSTTIKGNNLNNPEEVEIE